HRACRFWVIDCIGEQITCDVWLVAFRSMPVGTHPRNLIALNEASTDLINPRHDTTCWIIANNQVLLYIISCPRLTSSHLSHMYLAQLTWFFEATVPLPDRTLPFAHGYGFSSNCRHHVTADSSR